MATIARFTAQFATALLIAFTGVPNGPVHASAASPTITPPGTSAPVAHGPAHATATADTSAFKGANWSDAVDNYSASPLVLSGITAGDDYSTIKSKAGPILDSFRAIGANTVRLPVNACTVIGPASNSPCTAGSPASWAAYKGAIDAATDRGMKVVLAYWEEHPNPKQHTGRVDEPNWDAMWSRVIADYAAQPLVYFEPMNEPYGYTDLDWENLAVTWLGHHTDAPRSRVLIGGAGYDERTDVVGQDVRLNGTMLSLHVYDYVGNKGQGCDQTSDFAQFEYSQCVAQIAGASTTPATKGRTVITEFGSWTTARNDDNQPANRPGYNYDSYQDQPTNNPTGDPQSNRDPKIGYLAAVTNFAHDNHIGTIYWPGYEGTPMGSNPFVNNGYAVERGLRYGSQALGVNNKSALDRLQYAWGGPACAPGTLSNGTYTFRNAFSGNVLEVPGSRPDNGTQLDQWPYNGGPNQQWQLTDLGCGLYKMVNAATGKSIDVNGQSLADGAVVDEWDYTGGANEQFFITETAPGSKTYRIDNLNSLASLDDPGYATAAGTGVDQYLFDGGSNVEWTLVGSSGGGGGGGGPAPSSLSYSGAVRADYHDAFTASATLTSAGSPVSGADVTFALNPGSGPACGATTNADGIASCSLTPTQAAGSTSLTVSFAGTASVAPSSTTVGFTVSREETATSYTGPHHVANGVPVTLSGRLEEDGTSPITGRTMALTLGSGSTAQACTATTDASGTAACTIAIVDQPLTATATLPVTASFGGDGYYLPSQRSSTVRLEYYTGHSYGISGDINLLLASLSLPAQPDTGSIRTAHASSTDTPCAASVNTLLIRVAGLCPSVVTKLAPGTSTATATVQNISIGLPGLPVIGISGLTANSRTTCTGSTGSATLTLTLDGKLVTIPAGPDTAIPLPAGARLIIDEQSPVPGADQGLTVNAVHLIVPDPLGGAHVADIVVGSATSDAHNCS